MTVVRTRSSFQILLVILVVVSVFYSAIFAEILSVDDEQLITYLINLDPDGWSLKGLFVGGGVGYYYRPLLILTFLGDSFLWGAHESFMHLENVLLHAANSGLVYCIARELGRRCKAASPAVPLAAALLFGLHPLSTESVNWISGRTDLLAGCFLFLAMLLVLKGLRRNSLPLHAAAAASFLMATLAKETALFWFPAALFFVYCSAREEGEACVEPPASRTRAAAPYLLLSASTVAYFLLRHLAYSKGDGGIGLAVKGVAGGSYDLLNKLRVTLKVFGFYLKKLVFPLPLNFAIISVPDWYVPVGVAGVIFCCWLLYRRRVAGALLLMAACLISPALLVPLGRMAWTPVAERYLYMPAAFVVLVLVLFGARWAERAALPGKAVATAVALLILGNGYATYRRNLVWQHNLTLFQDSVQKSPDCTSAKNELARALENSGRHEEAKRIFLSNNAANEKFRIISEINKANYMAAGNDVEGAIAHLERLKYGSSEPMYDQYLSTLLRLHGTLEARQSDPARRRLLQMKEIELAKQLQAHTGNVYQLYRIGQLYFAANDDANAAIYFQYAADRAPEHAFYKAAAQKLANRLRRRSSAGLP